jgi:hypothetical protein
MKKPSGIMRDRLCAVHHDKPNSSGYSAWNGLATTFLCHDRPNHTLARAWHKHLPTNRAGMPTNCACRRIKLCFHAWVRYQRVGDIDSLLQYEMNQGVVARQPLYGARCAPHQRSPISAKKCLAECHPRVVLELRCRIVEKRAFLSCSFPTESTMSAKRRRKVYGVRRETRRPRGWTRWFHEGLLDTDAGGSVRLRTVLFGPR